MKFEELPIPLQHLVLLFLGIEARFGRVKAPILFKYAYNLHALEEGIKKGILIQKEREIVALHAALNPRLLPSSVPVEPSEPPKSVKSLVREFQRLHLVHRRIKYAQIDREFYEMKRLCTEYGPELVESEMPLFLRSGTSSVSVWGFVKHMKRKHDTKT